MSLEYDNYLSEHISNVYKGLQWMLDNLPLSKEEKEAVWDVMTTHSHDESKHDRDEYDAYDAYFYGGNISHKVNQDFNNAWLRHIHKNPHHWQYWVLLEDDPETGMREKPLMMPLDYIFEMIADWWTFSWRSNNLFEMFAWYAEHRDKQIMHPQTRMIVEQILKKIWDVLIMQAALEGKDTMDIEQQYMKFWMGQEMLTQNVPEVEHRRSIKESSLWGAKNPPVPTEFGHSGIKGQKWGIRRFQNYDGSLTEAGRERYGRALVKEKKAYDPSYRQEILNNSKATKDIMRKAKALDDELNDEYQKWSKDETAVKKDMATYYKKQGWPVEDVDKDYPNMGIDLSDDVWHEHITKDPQLNSKADRIHELGQDYRKEAEKIYRSLLEAYGNVNVNWTPSKENDGSMLEILTSKAGYDDYYDILYGRNYRGERRHTRKELQDGIKKLDKELEDLKADKNADTELIELIEMERNAAQEELEFMHSDISDDEEDKHKYGIPEQKKYPMPDKDHVKSAIRFFNYVDPKYEQELADAILERAEEYGLIFGEDITVGDDNKFKKYLSKEES